MAGVMPSVTSIQPKFSSQFVTQSRQANTSQGLGGENQFKTNQTVNKSKLTTLESQGGASGTNYFSQQQQTQQTKMNSIDQELSNMNEGGVNLSPKNLNMYKQKQKSGQGRKGNQVSQSVTLKQFRSQMNKSNDISTGVSANNSIILSQDKPNGGNSQNGFQSQVLGLQNMRQSNQSPSLIQGVKINQPMSLGNSLTNGLPQNQTLSQFQTFQQQVTHKRNTSLSGLQLKKTVQNSSSDNKRQFKPNSRPGGQSVDFTRSKPNDARQVNSNNTRINIVENDSLNLLNEQRHAHNELLGMNQSIKSNLIEQYANQQSLKQKLSQLPNQRPKTSFGYSSNAQEKFDSDQNNPPDDGAQNQIAGQIKDQNGQKSFIIKKGERNEGLRNYLRKSLDSTATINSRANKNSEITIPQLTTGIQQNQDEINTKKQALIVSGIQNQKAKRRDFSKVVANSQQVLQLNSNQQTQNQQLIQTVSNTPQKNGKNKGVVKKNLYQEQFQQLLDNTQPDQTQQNTSVLPQFLTIQQESRLGTKKPSERSIHSRTSTSQKHSRGNKQTPGVKMLRQSANEHNLEDATATIAENDDVAQLRSRSEGRPQSKQNKSNFQNLRASINQEVSTQQVSDSKQPQKFDNCVSKFAFATKTGFSPSNPYKTNQDSFLAMPHLGEYRRTHFFAVADGHGVFGKEVSEFVKAALAYKVEEEIKNIFDKAKKLQRVVDSNEVKDALSSSFLYTNQQLYSSSGIDIYFSGSTCVSVLIVGNKVFCANVGDSRAVLAREVSGQVSGLPLNRDHKANEPDEERRILMNGGRIEAFKDHNGRSMGPMRVWHLNENIPGLAMSRSFGDHAAAEVGVIAEPEIIEMNLTEEDKFIVIASDGVWEFLSNDEVVQIVHPHYLNNSAEKAAEALIRESLKKWKEEESVVDDITCIIIFLTIQS